VILSPDGTLNFISFATLLAADGRFLAEKVALSYVASGRDLLAEPPSRSAKTLVICAAPNFNASTRCVAAQRHLDRDPFSLRYRFG
jgi:hypothetical protein